MRVRAWCLIARGVLCGTVFLLVFVSKVFAGDLYAYVLMAMLLTASVLSVRDGRRQLSAPQATDERTASTVS